MQTISFSSMTCASPATAAALCAAVHADSALLPAPQTPHAAATPAAQPPRGEPRNGSPLARTDAEDVLLLALGSPAATGAPMRDGAVASARGQEKIAAQG